MESANPSKNLLRQQALSEIFYEQKIIKIFGTFRRAGIEPILIKGWSIARFYPTNNKRGTGDIDLTVHPQDFVKATKIIQEPENLHFAVDLHKGLRFLSRLSFNDVFSDSQLVSLREANIRVLSDEANLRLACVHWLVDGGAREHRLWDIFHLVSNRQPRFDWQKCLDGEGSKRRKWIICTIALAHKHLGLKIDDTPIAEEIKHPDVLPKWFISTVEKEWRSPVKLNSLIKSWRDPKLFVQQIGKRFAPNSIAASVDTEAPFDNTPRLPYQIADIFLRLGWSLRRNILKN